MEQPGDNQPREIKTDELADRAARYGGVIKLIGKFLGNSEREHHFRLYTTDNLNWYYEFSKDAVIDVERFPSGQIIAWLKPGAIVQETATRTVPEAFLGGATYRENAARAAGAPGMRKMFAMAQGDGCGSSVANCPDTQLSFTCNPRDPSPDCPYNRF